MGSGHRRWKAAACAKAGVNGHVGTAAIHRRHPGGPRVQSPEPASAHVRIGTCCAFRGKCTCLFAEPFLTASSDVTVWGISPAFLGAGLHPAFHIPSAPTSHPASRRSAYWLRGQFFHVDCDALEWGAGLPFLTCLGCSVCRAQPQQLFDGCCLMARGGVFKLEGPEDMGVSESSLHI